MNRSAQQREDHRRGSFSWWGRAAATAYYADRRADNRTSTQRPSSSPDEDHSVRPLQSLGAPPEGWGGFSKRLSQDYKAHLLCPLRPTAGGTRQGITSAGRRGPPSTTKSYGANYCYTSLPVGTSVNPTLSQTNNNNNIITVSVRVFPGDIRTHYIYIANIILATRMGSPYLECHAHNTFCHSHLVHKASFVTRNSGQDLHTFIKKNLLLQSGFHLCNFPRKYHRQAFCPEIYSQNLINKINRTVKKQGKKKQHLLINEYN